MARSTKARNNPKLSVDHVSVWKLEIAGYGDFLYVGTEDEAVERARLKADWEGSRTKPKVTRSRALRVMEARIYAKHGPDSLNGAPYHGEK